mgnify:CR=1 FL=1
MSREGNRLYAEMTNSIPARRDLLEEELHIIGYAEIRELLRGHMGMEFYQDEMCQRIHDFLEKVFAG